MYDATWMPKLLPKLSSQKSYNNHYEPSRRIILRRRYIGADGDRALSRMGTNTLASVARETVAT